MPRPTPAGRVLVVGSANRDLVVDVDRLPAPGETRLARGATRGLGGKGVNAAVAAARAGAPTAFVGAVGDDPDGRDLLDGLRAEGIATDGVAVRDDVGTGLAIVSVLPGGENAILVVAGANGSVGAEAVREALAAAGLGPGDVLVTSAEIPAPALAEAALGAAATGARAMVNLAPFRTTAPEVLAVSDPLVLNEGEAAALLGRDVAGLEAAAGAARALAGRVRSVVVSAGAAGAAWSDAAGSGGTVAAPRVEAVDTTGAGDALVGTLAAALARGDALAEAVAAAVRAASATVALPGAW